VEVGADSGKYSADGIAGACEDFEPPIGATLCGRDFTLAGAVDEFGFGLEHHRVQMQRRINHELRRQRGRKASPLRSLPRPPPLLQDSQKLLFTYALAFTR
jgi:hypothetical protein